RLYQVGVEHRLYQYWLQIGDRRPAVLESSADRGAQATQQSHLDIGELIAAHVCLTRPAHHPIEHCQAQVEVHLDDDAAGERLQLDQVDQRRVGQLVDVLLVHHLLN